MFFVAPKVWDITTETGEVGPVAGGSLVRAGQLPQSNVRTACADSI